MNEEIVGIVIDGMVISGIEAILEVQKKGDYQHLITRNEANFMACADFGEHWNKLSRATTLFEIDENGAPSKGIWEKEVGKLDFEVK